MITVFIEVACDHCGFREYHAMSNDEFLQKAHDLGWVVEYKDDMACVFCDQNCSNSFSSDAIEDDTEAQQYYKKLIRELENNGMHLEDE